jgi:hypothetical protein
VESLISAGAALAVLSSVVYNWAYFRSVGFSETEIITLSDIVASSLGWIPPVAAVMAAGLFVGTMRRPADSHLKPSHARRDYSFVALLTAFAAGAFLLAPAYELPIVVIILAVVWMVALPLLDLRPFVLRFSLRTLMLIFFLPPIFATAYCFGASAGNDNLKTKDFNATIYLHDETKPERAVVFRYLDRGVLYRRNNDNEIIFRMWESISHITEGAVELDPRSRFCVWSGLFCPDTARNSGRKQK